MSRLALTAAAGAAGGLDTDEFFENTVLLLHGDGTNGAQNNTFLDSSTNNFTITRNGNTTQGSFTPFSKPDGAFGIFTDSQHIAWNKSAFLALSGVTAYTIEFWMYPTAVGGAGGLVGQIYGINVSGRADSTWVGYDSSQKVGMINAGAGYTPLVSTTAVPLNEWTHVAITISGASGSATGKIYLNGVLDKTVTSMTTTIADVGGNAFTGTRDGSNYDYHGYLTNFRVVNGSVVYSSAFTPPTTPLTSITNTTILIYQSPRLVNNGATASALVANAGKVTPFSPFPITTEYSPSVNSGSGYFDGSGDYLTVPDNGDLDLGTGDFSVEFFWYPQSTSSQQYPLIGDSTGNWYVIWESGNISLGRRAQGNDVSTSGYTLVQNAWEHIVVTRQSTGTNDTRIFVNGVLYGVGTSSQNYTITTTLNIGATNTGTQPITGYLSNVRVIKGSVPVEYQTASTTTGTSIFTPPTSALTAVSGTELLCNFSNAGIFDNTMFNNIETVGNAQVDTANVKYGTGSLEFDGTGDYLLIKDRSEFAFGTGDFTIEMWLYARASGTYYVFDFRPSGSEPNAPWCFIDSGQVVFGFAGSRIADSGAFTINQNEWYHLAFVRGSGTFRLFVDGVQRGTIANTTTAVVGTNRPVIGTANNLSANFTGHLDEFKITTGVARYTANFTPQVKIFPDIGD